MKRWVCIHGHFYQPPRENPWLEAVELQDDPAPHHDWNARVTHECYGPNAASFILDERGWVRRVVNNYARLSFNFGPTLLSWLQTQSPRVYDAILAADRESTRRFSGHGSAIAQAYSHMILPLANERDRRTQVIWGVRDFAHRFGRRPEGMWLPETAADTPTLEALAEQGVAFTILAPRQAARVRRIGDDAWTGCEREPIDPTRAYRCPLPSGRSIVIFFYHGPISQGVAFEGLLHDGCAFARRVTDIFTDADHAQLAHIATDGESYGHHHRYGEMALAVALDELDRRADVRLTNYAEFLEHHPPTHEVQIHEPSSWSCAHGVERWRSDCGCTTPEHPGWNQAWRGPLREALDALRDELAPRFERAAGELVGDPWAARDEYIAIILDRAGPVVEPWLRERLGPAATDAERRRLLELLELQRHAMLMYTSCGWFFDDVARIETVQILRYAARACQLARGLFDADPEPAFLERLDLARSNDPAAGTARDLYLEEVLPTVVDLPRVGAHYAVSSLFGDHPERADLFCFSAERLDEHRQDAGRARFRVGRVRLTNRVTLETSALTYAVLHAGEHIITGGARRHADPERYARLSETATRAFEDGDLAGLMRGIEAEFGELTFSLGSLFRDEQRRIAELLCEDAIRSLESTFREVHDRHQPMLRYIARLGAPVPGALLLPARFIAHLDLERELERPSPDLERVRRLVERAARESVTLDERAIAFAFESMLDRLAQDAIVSNSPERPITKLAAAVELAAEMPVPINLAPTQAAAWHLLQAREQLDPNARAGADRLARAVRVRAPAPHPVA